MEKRFDVFGMCNALFDVQAEVDDEILAELGLHKGIMQLVSADEQRALYARVANRIVNTEAGGSGANTMIGIAQLGGTACFTSRVGPDRHGSDYALSLSALGVQPNLGQGDGDTGICLVMISPDAQRTMNTFLGEAQGLHAGDVAVEDIAASRYLYVTGYLWDTAAQKEAVLHAMRTANAAGTKVALSLSDPFCVGRHREDFLRLLDDHVDVVLANEEEALGLTGADTVEGAARELARRSGHLAVVTLGKNGALLVDGASEVRVDAFRVEAIDTTGAGDMYAAGILYGLTQGLSLEVTGRLAAYVAAQVVAQYGPRLEAFDRASALAYASAVDAA